MGAFVNFHEGKVWTLICKSKYCTEFQSVRCLTLSRQKRFFLPHIDQIDFCRVQGLNSTVRCAFSSALVQTNKPSRKSNHMLRLSVFSSWSFIFVTWGALADLFAVLLPECNDPDAFDLMIDRASASNFLYRLHLCLQISSLRSKNSSLMKLQI